MPNFEIELHDHADLICIYRPATEQERAEIERLRDSTPSDQRGPYRTDDGCDRFLIRAIPQLAKPPVFMVGTDIHVGAEVPDGIREFLDTWLRARASVFAIIAGRLARSPT